MIGLRFNPDSPQLENVCLPFASKPCYRLLHAPSQGKGFSLPWKEEPSLRKKKMSTARLVHTHHCY